MFDKYVKILIITRFNCLQLLEQPRYQDIIKIKTIGSTYMAASGLNPSRVVKVNALNSLRFYNNYAIL
jgi:hypothetical protein